MLFSLKDRRLNSISALMPVMFEYSVDNVFMVGQLVVDHSPVGERTVSTLFLKIGHAEIRSLFSTSLFGIAPCFITFRKLELILSMAFVVYMTFRTALPQLNRYFMCCRLRSQTAISPGYRIWLAIKRFLHLFLNLWLVSFQNRFCYYHCFRVSFSLCCY